MNKRGITARYKLTALNARVQEGGKCPSNVNAAVSP